MVSNIFIALWTFAFTWYHENRNIQILCTHCNNPIDVCYYKRIVVKISCALEIFQTMESCWFLFYYYVELESHLSFECIFIDGVDCPENMDRCVSNHYSLSGFWRSWHKSYNRWLMRYLYIPLVITCLIHGFIYLLKFPC